MNHAHHALKGTQSCVQTDNSGLHDTVCRSRVRVLPADAMRHARLPMEFPTRTVGLPITSLMKSTSCCNNRTINEMVCGDSMKQDYEVWWRLTSAQVSIVYWKLEGLADAPNPSKSIAYTVLDSASTPIFLQPKVQTHNQ